MHFETHWPLIVCGTVQLFTESEVPRIVKWAVRETLLTPKCGCGLVRDRGVENDEVVDTVESQILIAITDC